MIRLSNLTATPFVLPDGTPLPVEGEATVTAEVTANPAVAAWIEAGWIVAEDAPEPKRTRFKDKVN